MNGISFIICSSKLAPAKTCEGSIRASLGSAIGMEFIVIDNRKKKYDIFTVTAKGPIVPRLMCWRLSMTMLSSSQVPIGYPDLRT